MSSSSARKERRKVKPKGKAKGKTSQRPLTPPKPIPFQQEVSACASVNKRLSLTAQAQIALKEGFRAVFVIGTYACSAHGGGVHPLSVVAMDEAQADKARGDLEVIIQRMREVADDLELQLAGFAKPPPAPFN